MLRKLMVLSLLVLFPLTAGADELPCADDADCPEGAYCVMIPCAACPPDQECPPCESEGYCVEEDGPDIDAPFLVGECEDDSDCPDGFLCEEHEMPCNMTDCACPPCVCEEDDPDCECECDCPEPEPCDEETVKVCAFHVEECQSDSDCDEGWECSGIEECSGGGSVGCTCAECICPDCAPGEECPDCDCPEEPVCECDDEEEQWEEDCQVVAQVCTPKQQECETDADCLDGWECVGFGTSTCACPGCACESIPCPEDEPDCEQPDCDCPPCECDDEGDEEKFCLPGGWGEVVETLADAETGGEAQSPNDVAEKVFGTNEESDGGANPPAADPDNTGETVEEASGCSTGAPAAPLALLVLAAFLGLFTILRRRNA